MEEVCRRIVAEVDILDNDASNTSLVGTTARWISWVWPLPGYVKLNVDGSSRGNPGLAGFGGLIRSDNGRWLLGFHGFLGVFLWRSKNS